MSEEAQLEEAVQAKLEKEAPIRGLAKYEILKTLNQEVFSRVLSRCTRSPSEPHA